MRFKTSDGTEVYYDVQGQGTPLFFLTGLGGNAEIWAGQIKFLVKNGYQTITIEYRNHGRSDRTTKGLTLERFTQDVFEVLQSLDIKNPILIGNSMGGAIIFNLIKSYGWSFIKQAVIVDQSPRMINDTNWHFGFTNMTIENFKTTINTSLRHPYFKRVDDRVFKASKSIDIEYPFTLADNQGLLMDNATRDWRPILIESNTKIGFILGNESRFYNSNYADELLKINPQIKIEKILQAGHIPMAEQPDKFNETLVSYLNN